MKMKICEDDKHDLEYLGDSIFKCADCLKCFTPNYCKEFFDPVEFKKEE